MFLFGQQEEVVCGHEWTLASDQLMKALEKLEKNFCERFFIKMEAAEKSLMKLSLRTSSHPVGM